MLERHNSVENNNAHHPLLDEWIDTIYKLYTHNGNLPWLRNGNVIQSIYGTFTFITPTILWIYPTPRDPRRLAAILSPLSAL